MGGSVVTSTGQHIPPEALVGPYEILDELGKGGMGVVYRARHIHLNRIAALKMILGGMRISPEHLERFRTEAEAVAKLNHPNVVRVYDVGEHLGNPYIALELIEGGSLQKKAAGKPQNAKFSATMVESIARAVHEAHSKGIIHRDLKPANVLLTLDGQPKVTDFGLAKDLAEAEAGHTNAGSILGTPSYMAPEQAAGRVLDIGPATDVYALGAMLYELLVGHPPFRAETAIATIRLVLDGEVVSPRSILNSVPKDLDTICLKALEKPIHRRYASAEEMAEDLRRYLDGEPITARPIGSIERFGKWIRRKPAKAATLGTGLLAAVAMLLLGVWSYFAVTKRAHEAEISKRLADDALMESTRRLVRLNVSNGTRLMEDQDYLGSVLWYAEALRLEPGGPERERMHRTRINAVLARCPKLSNFWLHDASVTACDFDSTGKRILTASDDGTARVWDAETGKAISPPLEHGTAIKYAVLTPNGKYAVTAGMDGALKCWDVALGSVSFSASLSVQFTGIALTQDGSKVAVCGAAGRVRIWELPSGKDVSRMTSAFTERTTGLAFSPDGVNYVVGSADGTARVFNTATSEPITTNLRHSLAINSVAFAPNGKHVATASMDGTAMIWDIATAGPALAAPLRHGDEVTYVAFSPNGKLIVTASKDRTAQAWDAESGRAIGRPAVHASGINSVSFSPDGLWYVTASEDNSTRVWDTYTGNPVSPPFRGNATPTTVMFSPNGRQLLIPSGNRVALLWDLSETTNDDLAEDHLNHAVAPAAVTTVVSPDGTRSIGFGGGQAIRIRRTSDFEPVSPPLRTVSAVTAVAFHPSGATVVTGDADGGIMLWNVADGSPIWNSSARHSSKILALGFSPDGKTLASGSDDNSVGLWSVETGEATVPAIRLGASALAVHFGAQGRTLTTHTPDGSQRIWDVQTGEPLSPMFQSKNNVDHELTADTGSVDFLRSLGRVLSSVNVNESGGLVAFDSVERRKEYQQLREKEPMRFAVSKDTIRSWHELRAAMTEREGKWFAAAWHLDQLLAMSADNVDLSRRRANVAAELGDWKRASQDASKTIQLRPTRPAGWYQRAVARGHLGKWGESAADFAVAVSLVNDATFAVGLPALVAAEAKDVEGYRKACEQEWSARATHTDPKAVLRLALATSIRTDSGIPTTDILTATQEANAKVTSDPFAASVLALAHYRMGQFEEAEKQLALLTADKTHQHPVAWAITALIHAKRGNAVQRKIYRDLAAVWLATADPASPQSWDVRITVASLLSELEP